MIWAYRFENKADGFLLFLKAFSWEIDLCVTLGDFTVKNVKLGRDICIYKLKIEWVEKKYGVRHNHNYMCHICAKGFLDSNFN